MTGGAGRCLVPVRRLSFVWMVLPDFRIGRMTTPTSLARGLLIYSNVFGAGGHRRGLSADDPEDGEQGDDANGND